MQYLSLEQTIRRINTIVDDLLVTFANDPNARYLFTLPALIEGTEAVPVFDCQEYRYCISSFRQVVTYKYLLCALKSKQMLVNKETLFTCISQMRQTPFVDYYDLGDYHEFAYHFYQHSGNEKKARRHLLACYYDRGRAILSSGKTFDCKDLILTLMKEHDRMKSFLLYVVNFIHYDFEEVQDFLTRSQYLLIERALVLAVKLFAENAACHVDLRCSIYYLQANYYEKTGRADMAKSIRQTYKKLGGNKKYELNLVEFLMAQADPQWSDERFLDYMLYVDSIEPDEIYPRDEEGNIDLEIEPEDPIVVKDGRSNFMDTFYRPMSEAQQFYQTYECAEQGNQQAIRDIVSCFRNGNHVTLCESAAQAWEKKIKA